MKYYYTNDNKNQEEEEKVEEEKLKTSRHFVSQLIVQNDILREEKEQMEHYVYQLWNVHTNKKKESPEPPHQRQTAKKKKKKEDEDGEKEKEKEITKRQNQKQHQKKEKNDNDRCINCGFCENDDGATTDTNTRSSAASPPEREHQPQQPQKKLQKHKHKGTWIVSKDTLEFLKYPAEAKQALRVEKQKRLTKVKEEMKFIIDSDDQLQDTNGYWDCCQQGDSTSTTKATNNYYDTPCTCD